VLRVFTSSSIDFLFHVSLALYSSISNPSSFDIKVAEVVLPMPGGPEIKHAQALGFGASAQLPNFAFTSFLFPLMTTSSQSHNHSLNESIAALLPTRF